MPVIIRERNEDGTFGNLVKKFKGYTQSEQVENLLNDVDVVAESIMVSTDDVIATAETVAILMDVIIDLQIQINELKGGNA